MSLETELRQRSRVGDETFPSKESVDSEQADTMMEDDGEMMVDDMISTEQLMREAVSEGELDDYESIKEQKEYLERLIAEERMKQRQQLFLDSVKFSPLRLFGVLLLVRFLNVFLVQTYYVADEYWQSLEVAHNMVYGYGHLTWEWKAGIRGYTHPLMFAGLYKSMQLLKIDHPMVLILMPRLVQGLIAAIGDVYLYKLGQKLFGSETAYWVLLCYLTSWFVCYISTRTLSNTTEMILLIIGLYYYPWPDNYLNEKTKRFPNWVYLSIAAFACIIRPTAAIVWLPFCLWHFIKTESKLRLIFLGILPVGICAGAWSAWIDKLYYGQWTFVQYNFLKYNVFENIGANYGSHPFYWYAVTGIPVMLGTHIVPFYFGVQKCWKESKYRELIYLMLWTIIVYSILSHKEFRFLSSILPIAMFYCGMAMYHYSKKVSWGSFLILSLLITNLPVALYFGMIHQRGTMDLMPYLQNMCHNSKDPDTLPSITFLMPCHSTPYYSHLHANVKMKFLDCSPNWKNRTGYTEEADRFYKNPKKWLNSRYSREDKQPTILVFYSVLKGRIKAFLKEHNYKQVSSFFHTHFPEGKVGKKVLVYRKTSDVPPEFTGNFERGRP